MVTLIGRPAHLQSSIVQLNSDVWVKGATEFTFGAFDPNLRTIYLYFHPSRNRDRHSSNP
jgi:hypothetical protein